MLLLEQNVEKEMSDLKVRLIAVGLQQVPDVFTGCGRFVGVPVTRNYAEQLS